MLSPDGDEGGGGGGEGDGGGAAIDHEGGEGNLDGQGGGGEGVEGGEGDEGDPKPTGLTKDDITSILSTVINHREEAPRKEPEKQYTQAEIDTLLNVWKPDTAFLKKLGFENPTADQLAAVHEMRDHLIRQANTMSEARVQQLLSKYEERLTELGSYVNEQRAAADVAAFYTTNPELKPYEEIVEAVSSKLESSGFKANTKKEVFAEIAKSTKEVLKRMNVKVDEKKPGSSGQRAGSRMATLAGGGSGGGGKGGGGRPARKEGMSIFDPVDE